MIWQVYDSHIFSLYDSYMVPRKVATAFLCEQQSFAASIFCLGSRFSCKTIGAAWKKRKLQIVLENWSNQVLPWKQGHLFAATTNSLISPWWRKIMFTPHMKQMGFCLKISYCTPQMSWSIRVNRHFRNTYHHIYIQTGPYNVVPPSYKLVYKPH